MVFEKRFLGLAVIVALLVGGAWTYATITDHEDWDDSSYYKSEERLTADLAGVTTVKINNINGSIKATIGSANRLDILSREKVNEKVKVGGIDPAEMASVVKMVTRKEGSTLIVDLDYGKFKEENKYRGYYQSSYEVTLPARLNVWLDTTNGSISAPRFEGDIDLETTNGSITAEGCTGNAVLDTTNGSIKVGMVNGTVKAETTNGNIEISSSGGPVNAETTNGNIEVDLTGALAGDMSLETTNGSISFKAGAGSSYTLKAETTHGRVYGPDGLEVNKRRTYASGSVGGGKYKVTLDTTNGSIHVK